MDGADIVVDDRTNRLRMLALNVEFLPCATAAFAVGLMFLRFWRETGHRLLSFRRCLCLMALCWSLLALLDQRGKTSPLIYTIRLIAYVLLIVGMIERRHRA